MNYSVIIPVYNRPDEVDELLESLTHQTVKDFEVVVVEDGSTVPCKEMEVPVLPATMAWNIRKASMC